MAQLTVDTQSRDLDKLQRQFDKLSKAEQKMILKGSAVGKSIDQGARRGTRGIDRMKGSAKQMISSLSGVAGGVGLVTSAIMGAKKEWADFQQRMKEAARTQMSLTESRAMAIDQKPTGYSTDEMDKLIAQVSKDANITRQTAYQNVTEAFSATTSNVSRQQLRSALTQSGKMKAVMGANFDMNAMAGAIIDIMKVTGEEKAVRTHGWLRQFGKEARISSTQKQGKALAPVLQAGASYGASPEESAEMLAALSQLGADPTGEKSRTATIHILEKIMNSDKLESKGLMNRLGEMQRKITGRQASGLVNEAVGKATEGMTEEERKKFFKGFGGEKQFRGAFRGLLTGGDKAMEALQSARSGIKSSSAEGLAKISEKYIKDLHDEKFTGTKRLDQTAKRIRESLQAAEEGAIVQKAKEEILSTLKAGNTGWISRQFNKADLSWDQLMSGEDEHVALRKMAKTLRTGDPKEAQKYEWISEFGNVPSGEYFSKKPKNFKMVGEEKYLGEEYNVYRTKRGREFRANPDYDSQVETKIEALINALNAEAKRMKEINEQQNERRQQDMQELKKGLREGAREGTREGTKEGSRDAKNDEPIPADKMEVE